MIMRLKKGNYSICFVGDMIFGDQPATFGYGTYSTWNRRKYKGVFKDTSKILRDAGVVIGNFECTIADGFSEEIKNINNYMMCCESAVCRELFANNIRIVSVANNHTFDYGIEGYKQTVDALEKGGIFIIGDKKKPYVIIESDMSHGKVEKIAVIGCSYIKIKKYKEAPYLCNPTMEEFKRIIDDIGDQADYVIAFIHWGNEFVKYPTKEQEMVVQGLIKIGVNDIIGCHSHILQTREKWDGHHIYYSLGNFISDYWQKRLRHTVILKFDLRKKDYSLTPCYIDKYMKPQITMGLKKNVIESNKRSGNLQIAASRNLLRIEYIMRIILNYRRIKGKKELACWVIDRIRYFYKNIGEEIKNPNVIYQEFEVKQK